MTWRVRGVVVAFSYAPLPVAPAAAQAVPAGTLAQARGEEAAGRFS